MSDAAPADPAPARKPRRERSATESLLTITLGLEAFLVFFAALTAFGLRAVEPALALAGGGALILALVIAGGVVRFPWGIWIAWGLQALLVATGFIIPMMFLLGTLFLALFVFCFVRGRQLDSQKAAYLAAQSKENNA